VFKEALRIDVSSTEAMECLGLLGLERTDLQENQKLRQAESWFLKALKFERTARTLSLLGATYQALDNQAGAKLAFEEAIQRDKEYTEAIYKLATIEAEANPLRAIELFELAL
jgi:tetratricopeptide (TPR) repeat protein